MATAAAMSQPHPPRGPPQGKPPPPKGLPPLRPPPPKGPPPSLKRNDAVMNPRNNLKRPVDEVSGPHFTTEKMIVNDSRNPPDTESTRPQEKESVGKSVTIRKPVVLRDVNEAYQKKHQVGQGMYGNVFMGADKETGEIVALKRIKTEQEENGFPITAIREVKILKALNHDNIVKLKEIVTSKEQDEIPKNVFMVFEYHEYDLTGILETSEIKLTQDHIKSWSQQLLNGVHYMHVNQIIHRDLKSSNILINRRGELRIADWGLARSWNDGMKRLTNCVITLWYRPIELLLGCSQYSTKIDMWSCGCIISELFRRDCLLKGSNEASQLDLIFKICGHPTVEDWPKIYSMCPLWKNFEPGAGEVPFPSKLRQVLKEKLSHPLWMTDNAMNLIENLLLHDPDKRWSAAQALTSEFFFETPLVKRAQDLSMKFGVEAIHEWEARKKHEEMRQQAVKYRNSLGVGHRPPPPGNMKSKRHSL